MLATLDLTCIVLLRESRGHTEEFISLASWSKIQKQMGMHPVIAQAYCNNGWAPNVGNVGFPVLFEHMAEKWSLFWITKLDWIKVSIQWFQEFSWGNIRKCCMYLEITSVYLQLNNFLAFKLLWTNLGALVFTGSSFFFFVTMNEMCVELQNIDLTCFLCLFRIIYWVICLLWDRE